MKTKKPTILIAISGPAGSGRFEVLQRVFKALGGAEYEVVDLDNDRVEAGPRARIEVFTTNRPLERP